MLTGICGVIVVFRLPFTASVSTDPRSAPGRRTVHSLEAGSTPIMFSWLPNPVGHPMQPLILLSQKVEPFDMPHTRPGCLSQSVLFLYCIEGI